MKTIKSAEIIAVGTELLLGDIVNTNAAYLSRRLAALGVGVFHSSVVGDNAVRLLDAIRVAAARCDLVILTGGLGPTCDDITKETAAKFFGLDESLDEEALRRMTEYFAATGRVMSENNIKQALIPIGAIALQNDCGTAPGVIIEGNGGADGSFHEVALVLLPGPPVEMTDMFEKKVVPYIKAHGEGVIFSRNLHLFGIGESAAEELLRPLMERENPSVAPYAGKGEVRIRVTARASGEAEAARMCDGIIAEIKETPVGTYIYGIDIGNAENLLLRLVHEAGGLTVCTAESCTGGLVAERITNIPGCSDVFLGGAVTYSNAVKTKLLGVSTETLSRYGAVSEQTALEMAEGIRASLGANIGISTTGIAGPGGGTPDKPVGTVFVAVSFKADPRDKSKPVTKVKKLSLSPMRDRDYIRYVSATNAIMLACGIIPRNN